MRWVGMYSTLSLEKTSLNIVRSNSSGRNLQNISRGISARKRSSEFFERTPAAVKASAIRASTPGV
eukprot:CAMPEP_0115333408 /NCGR_PEP_ID=MMETSP0270-20121206/87357_1 /TAXON_ID=71861 /ORGANISM="Scrippsiella trochoidea, Strain CCMP3099" /LENGTH=65 /DNA_ID=CAMNT_0002754313 /DNA_START=54 /DNA_END=251 /DNA_ORIENTATION=+